MDQFNTISIYSQVGLLLHFPPPQPAPAFSTPTFSVAPLHLVLFSKYLALKYIVNLKSRLWVTRPRYDLCIAEMYRNVQCTLIFFSCRAVHFYTFTLLVKYHWTQENAVHAPPVEVERSHTHLRTARGRRPCSPVWASKADV